MKCAFGAILAMGLLAVCPAGAQAPERTLTIGYADRVSSLDPQFNNYSGDRSLDVHFWDLLIVNTENELRPQLAESWKALDDRTWEFHLRPGVRWHDGQPFTAEDVQFSYNRAPNVPGSLATFAGYLRTIDSMEITDPLTIKIRTKDPNPLLPLNLASVHIVSKHVGEKATTEDYNSGRAVVGTGPYRLVSYTPGDRVIMRRNEDYWGGVQPWSRVNYVWIGNAASRTAALLAGDVDVIDKVSESDLAQLRTRADVEVFAFSGLRVLLMLPNFSLGSTAFARSNDGKPLATNPLLDPRVRQALSIAINREGLTERLMAGTAEPAGQWMPADTFGYNKAIPVPKPDPEGARRLLAQAGFPDGFQLTVHVPSDSYVKGPETVQGVAQMWTRIGVRTTVEAVPWATYATRAQKAEYLMSVLAWGNGTGEASYALINVLGSYDPPTGRGALNWGRYNNPAVDKALDQAMMTFDDNARRHILEQSAELVNADTGVIPLFHYQIIWAAHRGLVVKPLTSDRTAAQMVTAR